MSWIQTYSMGRFYYDERMKESDVRLIDIVHALSHINRYGGHTVHPYCVAQHSVNASKLPWLSTREARLAVLFHDAHEAYCGDVVNPLKMFLQDYKEAEDTIQQLVLERFGLASIMEEYAGEVKIADRHALYLESEYVLKGGRLDGWMSFEDVEHLPTEGFNVAYWTPLDARYGFLRRVCELTGEFSHLHILARETLAKETLTR